MLVSGISLCRLVFSVRGLVWGGTLRGLQQGGGGNWLGLRHYRLRCGRPLPFFPLRVLFPIRVAWLLMTPPILTVLCAFIVPFLSALFFGHRRLLVLFWLGGRDGVPSPRLRLSPSASPGSS